MIGEDDVLGVLRASLEERGLDGFLIPRADRHQGEYVPDADMRLAFATGFTGSAGLAVALLDRAALFVDGRYELQAAEQVDATRYEIVFLRQKSPEAWLGEALSAGQRLGYDPWLHTAEQIERLKAAVEKAGAEMVAVDDNPLDAIWADRPAPPAAPIRPHPEALAGESAQAKRLRLAEALKEAGADAAVLTQPDSICWLLNIRGADVAHNPVALAYAILDADGSVALFTDLEKIDDAVQRHFGNGVWAAPWDSFEDGLKAQAGRKTVVEKSSAPIAVSQRLEAAGAEILWLRDPCSLPKAQKNETEIAGARAAHRRDGAALAAFLAWIDAEAPRGALTELGVSERLRRFRAEAGERDGQPLVDESFDAIVGFGPHGAVVHYRVTEESSLAIQGDGLLLIDSGGQFADGTTDVTRTVVIGASTAKQRAAATRVLKGLIAVCTLRFPPKTRGREIDAFARRALWEAGLDYDHGTGHGVGSFLSVHEGPAGLSKRSAVELLPGMILSDEPGYYRAGAFGVRLENLVLVTEESVPEGGERAMRGFETLTLAPFDRRLLEPSLLSVEERAWLDAYHARVLAEIGPLVAPDVRAWLEAACAPLS